MDDGARLERPTLRVYLLDIFCTVPYYLSAVCLALHKAGVDAVPGTTSYYTDRSHFKDRHLKPDPGLVDVVAWLPHLSAALRRPLKLIEALLNMAALTVRFAIRPPDVLHIQYLPLLMRGFRLETWFLSFCRRRGSRLVYTVHDILPPDTGIRHKRNFRDVYQQVDAVICHNRATANQLAREFDVPVSRIHVIPHGPLFAPGGAADPASSRARLRLPPDSCLVLFQGIFKPYKGVPFLLDAWDLLPDTTPPALLLLVGTGEPELLREIQSRIAASRRPGSVLCDFRFVSEQELSDYYDAADIVVFPYREITTSGALLTALSRHKPIVATKCPAFVELLHHDQNALLVEYGDAVQLSEALAALICDKAQRSRIARDAASLLDGDLSWDTIARKTRDCYEEVLRGPNQ